MSGTPSTGGTPSTLTSIQPLSVYDAMPFGQPKAWLGYVREHMLRHELYAPLFSSSKGISTPMFFLGGDDVSKGAPREMMLQKPDQQFRAWALRHSQIHTSELNSINVAEWSGLAYPDLTNPKSMSQWMFFHNYVHDLTDLALGL